MIRRPKRIHPSNIKTDKTVYTTTLMESENGNCRKCVDVGGGGGTAVVFDYDWSLINCNSDTYIFDKLWPERPAIVEEQYMELGQWTKSMNRALQLLREESNNRKDDGKISIDDILQCVARVPVQDSMLDAVRYAKERNATLFIVSDANTVFIEAFLHLQEKEAPTAMPTESTIMPGSVESAISVNTFERIVSNKGEVKDNWLSIHPYYDFDNKPPHGCPLCPPNMCKGDILQNELHALQRFDQIIYIGDGGGDYCPASLLRKNNRDVVLARKDYPLAQYIHEKPIQADVREWETGADVMETFRAVIPIDS